MGDPLAHRHLWGEPGQLAQQLHRAHLADASDACIGLDRDDHVTLVEQRVGVWRQVGTHPRDLHFGDGGFGWRQTGGATGRGPQAVLVSNATGAPQVTPQQLLAQALGELKVPYLGPATAPPRGRDGLVGLPEWFWVPAGEWHARSVTVTAGPVWATATATPVGLTFHPGAGLNALSCAGPGTAYNLRKPAAQQHTTCSYTFLRPSAGLPGNAYQASVTVTWRISWTGSGGVGGVLDAALAVPVAFTVPVAQGEALVTSP